MEIVIKSNQIGKKPHPLVFVMYCVWVQYNTQTHSGYMFCRLKLSLNSKYNSAFFRFLHFCAFAIIIFTMSFFLQVFQIIEIWMKLNISLTLFRCLRVVYYIKFCRPNETCMKKALCKRKENLGLFIDDVWVCRWVGKRVRHGYVVYVSV